jgi:hypothetical protein
MASGDDPDKDEGVKYINTELHPVKTRPSELVDLGNYYNSSKILKSQANSNI